MTSAAGQRRGARPPPARLATTTLVVVLLVVLAACAARGPSDGRGERDARNRAESDAVNKTLGELPGVLRVDGGYTRDASNAGGAVVLSVTVRPGTDLRRVAEQAVRLVWLSRLDPIASMTVTVGPDGMPSAAIDEHADFTFDKDQLVAKYGPRPTLSS